MNISPFGPLANDIFMDGRFLIKASFDSRAAASSWIEQGLPNLPVEIHPTHFGEHGRTTRRVTNQLTEIERFAFHRSKNPGGFDLYGDGFTFDITFFDHIPSEIIVWFGAGDPRFEKHGFAVLELFARAGAFWCFAGCWDEYAARNRFRIVYVDGGDATGFIGRDVRRYVPGLFWLNYFSNDYIVRMEIDVEELAARLKGTVVPLAEGKILRLYDRPSDWLAQRDKVDDVIQQTKNFFSMRNVHIPKNLVRRNPKDFMWSPSAEWP